MNNFISKETDNESQKKVPKHLESLTTEIFQSLFPPLNPQTTPLASIRRVMLLNREKTDDGSYIINLRHYAITTKATGLSRPIRRLNAAEKLLHSQKSGKGKKGGLPNLGKLEDIADYMVGGADGEGYMTDATSGSEVDTDAEVEVVETRAKKILSRKKKDKSREDGGKPSVEKRAVKLVETGPRIKMRMTKVEEGMCSGKVMWHERIHKSAQEIKELDQVWEKRRQEKEARKKIQRENVEKKRKAKGLGAKGDEDEDEDDEMDVDEWDSDGLEGDAEMDLNEEQDEKGEWEDQEEEIAAG
jgi:ribosome biogenesis protein SSF1/2